nr:hypothetical protein [Dysgonomonas alginatilytica]
MYYSFVLYINLKYLLIYGTDTLNVNSSVNIKDIESIEVLKDASMYGLKGSNGVIIIKTKIN